MNARIVFTSPHGKIRHSSGTIVACLAVIMETSRLARHVAFEYWRVRVEVDRPDRPGDSLNRTGSSERDRNAVLRMLDDFIREMRDRTQTIG